MSCDIADTTLVGKVIQTLNMAVLSETYILNDLTNKYSSYFNHNNIFTKEDIAKKIEVLLDMKKMEPTFFELSPVNYNALSFYLFQEEQYDNAMKYIDYVQKKWPMNLMAKINVIFMNLQVKQIAKAKRFYCELVDFRSKWASSGHFHKETLLTEAGLALFFQKMTIKGYPTAFKLYQPFLDGFFTRDVNGHLMLDKDTTIPIETSELTWWCYNIIRLYDVMLNEGNISEFDDDFKRKFDPRKHGYDIFCLCDVIIEAEVKSEQIILSGRAYVELADAIMKIWYGYRIDITQDLPKLMTAREYMEKGYATTPQDAYVLERVGRNYRKSAQSKQDILKAVNCLQHCITCSPKHHIAWHQLGLAYRTLWIIYNNCPEKVAYLRRSPPVSDSRQPGYNNPYTQRQDRNRTRLSSHSKRIPYYGTKPKINDVLKASNPKSHSHSTDAYLFKARECMEEACHIVKDTSHAYLIDLARVHISLNQADVAENKFLKAYKIKGSPKSNFHLIYEQWALFKLSQKSEDTDEQKDFNNDGREMCRMSVKMADKKNVPSRVAYFTLKDSIEKEIEQEKNPDMRHELFMEKVYLHKLVGQYEDAIRYLETTKKDDPGEISNLWKMVDIYKIQETEDAYLKAYEKLEKVLKHQSVLSNKQKKLAIEVITIAADLCSFTIGIESIGKLFSLLCCQTSQSNTDMHAKYQESLLTETICTSKDGKEISDPEGKTSSICSGENALFVDVIKRSESNYAYHIVLIGNNRYDDIIQFAERAFEDAGLVIFTHTTDNYSDGLVGQQSLQSVEKALKTCLSVVIHPEVDDKNEEEDSEEEEKEKDEDGEDEGAKKEDLTEELCRVVEEAILIHPSHLCCLISGRTLINVPLKRLPSVDMTKYLSQVSQPHGQANRQPHHQASASHQSLHQASASHQPHQASASHQPHHQASASHQPLRQASGSHQPLCQASASYQPNGQASFIEEIMKCMFL